MKKRTIALLATLSIVYGINADSPKQIEDKDEFTSYFLMKDLPKCPEKTNIGEYLTVRTRKNDSNSSILKQGIKMVLKACKDRYGIQVKVDSIYYGVDYNQSKVEIIQ